MITARAIRGWRQMLVNQGLAATVKTGWERIQQRGKRGRERETELLVDSPSSSVHPFDTALGLDTSGLIWGEHLPSGKGNDRWNTAYYGIAPSVFRAMLQQCALDYSRFTFVDIGSGKGRAVMLAAEYPFHKVMGVELAPELHAVAEANVAKFRAAGRMVCKEIELLNGDAAQFVFPDEPLVLFFYHPFCKPVLKRVLANMKRSLQQNPREAWVLYVNPELRKTLDGAGFLQQVWEATVHMEPEDQLADRVGSTAEVCAIYKSRIGSAS